MGTSNSSALHGDNQKRHLHPKVRAENRFKSTAADDVDTGPIDVTVDKYDYLIIFPSSKPHEKQDKPESAAALSIKWQKARKIWFDCIPGDDNAKQTALQHLTIKWRERTTFSRQLESPEDDDELQYDAWLDVAKHTIIDHLYASSGLQLKVSELRGTGRQLCRVRAPMHLLQKHAHIEGYRLQFKGEVDPGYEFWNDEEIEEEQRVISSRDEANELLERLYQHKKISPVDVAVFDDETSHMWSRRIHTLERIADRVPVDNQYPASASFRLDLQSRHLFQTYPSVRGRTLFRSKDRLYLTFAILQNQFDFELLADRGVIESITALHDANRGERLTREVLLRRWVTFWKNDASRIGAPLVTHPAIQDGVRVPWYLIIFSQPLMEVREYFGEKLALYFAWLGFYAFSLIIPACFGFALNMYYFVNGYPEGFSYSLIAFALFIFVWTSLYSKGWLREQAAVAVKWGMHGYEDVEKDRPQFHGDKVERSHVTNRMEQYFSEEKRMFRQFLSLCVVLVCVSLLCGAVAVLFDLEYYLETEKGYWWGSSVCSLYSAIQIQILSALYATVVRQLNDWENHRTETTYQDNLILKTFLFQIVNNYAALTYTAFIKPKDLCTNNNCMADIRELLISIFLVRFVMNGNELGYPYIKSLIEKEKGILHTDEETALLDGEAGPSFEAEINFEPYDGTFDDYAEIVIQFGYVVLFASAFPLVICLALIENVIEIRVDAFKICALTRRPHVELAEDVGAWGGLMEGMALLGVLSNTALIVWTDASLGARTQETKWLVFIVAANSILILKYLIYLSVNDFPEWLQNIVDRQKFVVQKHLYGVDDTQLTRAAAVTQKGHLDTTEVEGWTLSSIKGPQTLPQAEKEKIKELEGRRRKKLGELKVAKESLQTAYRSEVYNTQTGVSETHHGLPLGCLNLKLVEIYGFEAKPNDVQVLISLRSTKQGERSSPGPKAELSRVATAGTRERSLIFNQAFVFAPIRFIDAEIVLDILDKNADPQKQGTAKLPLRDLADQEEHDLPLSVSIRADDAGFQPSDVRVYVQVKFMYSKTVPLQNKIFQLQDEIRTLERELASRKTGRK